MRYLKKLKEEIVTKYSKKIEKESATEEQKQEYEEAKKDLEAKEKSLVEPKKSFFFRLFRRRLYLKQVAEYNKGLEDIDAARKRITSAGLILEQKETAVAKLEEAKTSELAIFEGMDLEISRNAAVKQPSLLDSEEYKASCKKIREYIDEMIKIDPNLVNDAEFMSACVEFDMNLITLDKTNDSTVYQTFLEQYKEFSPDERKLLNEGYSRDDIERINETYTQLMQELTNPAYVSDGKFKIPHRFIFERIRAACAPNAKHFGIGEICDFAYAGYKEHDGKLSQAEGETFVSLLEDDDKYLYLYEQKENDLLGEFVNRTGISIEPGKTLSSITRNTKNSRLDLLNLLSICKDGNIVIAQVPKTEIDGKQPIIGYEDTEPDTSGWLLPKYIVGSTRDGVYSSNEYLTNPELAGEIAKYDFLASDGARPTKAQQLTSN